MALSYAVVTAPDLARERFATIAGTFLLQDLPPGPVRLLIRRLGYLPAEITVRARADTTDTVRVVLQRAAVRLAEVRVRAFPDCHDPGPPRPGGDSALATIFAQLRMNADQYRVLARNYPFAYFSRAHVGHQGRDSVMWVDWVDTLRMDGVPRWRYKPGNVVTRSQARRSRNEQIFHLPMLIHFADSVFIANHCFHNGGIVREDSATFYRVDLVAASRIRAPDVNGSIYLDSATFQIRRSVLSLSRLPPRIPGLVAMEVTTVFEEYLPSIPVMARVSARQWFDTSKRGVRYPMTFEEQRLIEFAFLKAIPGDERKP